MHNKQIGNLYDTEQMKMKAQEKKEHKKAEWLLKNDCEVRKNKRNNKTNAPTNPWIPGFWLSQLTAMCVRLGNGEKLQKAKFLNGR